MSSLPSQTKEEWEEELQKTVELNPEHISAYQLIIEEGTPFYENMMHIRNFCRMKRKAEQFIRQQNVS